MTVLAFDTCFGRISVAVRHRGADGSWQTTSVGETLSSGHAERLLPMVQHAMRDAGVAFADLSRIAVSVGPGTFTGVRTGIAAARAIALAAGKPACGIGSLALLRQTAIDADADAELAGRPLAVAVDARRGEVYFQLFAGDARPLAEPQILSVGAALDRLPPSFATIGSGGPVLQSAGAGSGRDVDVLHPDLEADARSLAAIAGTLPILAVLKPLYLRPPDAKPQTAKTLPRA